MRSATKGIRFLGSICLLLAVSTPLISQSTTGRILGEVVDPSGAALVGATVTVTDTQRATSRVVQTDSSGNYAVPNLVPGVYAVRAEAKGFKAVEHPNLRVEVATDLTVDLTLPTGDVRQTVVVTDDVPLVNLTTATLGGTLSNREINDLPLNGRNYENLLQLRPGVIRYPGGGFSTTSANGLRVKITLISSMVCSTASHFLAKASSTELASLVTRRRFCRLTPSRNSICSRILQRNMGGSRARS